MIYADANAIRLYQRRNIGRFSPMVMPDYNLGTILPLPTHRTGTRCGVQILGIKQSSGSKQRIKSADLGKDR
jgi:hypothetical protein